MSGNIADHIRIKAATVQLREHILSFKKPKLEHDPHFCALARVAVQRGTYHTIPQMLGDVVVGYGCNLIADAQALGFTADEARGIMNGWDVTSGRSKTGVYKVSSWNQYGQEGIDRGFPIGAEMYELAKSTGTL